MKKQSKLRRISTEAAVRMIEGESAGVVSTTELEKRLPEMEEEVSKMPFRLWRVVTPALMGEWWHNEADYETRQGYFIQKHMCRSFVALTLDDLGRRGVLTKLNFHNGYSADAWESLSYWQTKGKKREWNEELKWARNPLASGNSDLRIKNLEAIKWMKLKR